MIENTNCDEEIFSFNNWSLEDDSMGMPDRTALTTCCKSKDSILVNNLIEKKVDLNWYIKSIDTSSVEIFIDFSIEASKSGKMNEQEWRNCIAYLKKILSKITVLKKSISSDIDFRVLLIFKGDCYSNSGPPPKPKYN